MNPGSAAELPDLFRFNASGDDGKSCFMPFPSSDMGLPGTMLSALPAADIKHSAKEIEMGEKRQNTLYLLGTGTLTPTKTRFGTAYVLQIGEDYLLFDWRPCHHA